MIHKLRYIDVRPVGAQVGYRRAYSYCRQDIPFDQWVIPGQNSSATWSTVDCPTCLAMAPDHSTHNKSNERYKQRLRESRRRALAATEIDDGPH